MAKVLPKLTPEVLIPRLGDYLLEKGLIDEAALQKALDYQDRQVAAGKSCLLGQALMDCSLLDRATLDQAITEQIIALRSALEDSNRNLEQRVKERTAELQEALERLSELSQMKANFIANISHELRTPLTHVKGYLELMAAGALGPLTEEQQQALQVSQRSTNRLESLIEDLIMFSLASHGEMSMKLEGIDIKPLLETIKRSAAQKAESRGVKLDLSVPQDLPHVQVDSQKIGWALAQLVDNGIKFTSAGGWVQLSARVDSDQLVILSVSDSGIGIPSARLAEVFEPFHQLDGSSKRRYGGTGLGLSLVRQIVEAHGSLLEIQSEEGVGSVFTFPLAALKP